ncbi:MAG: uroporphyrinogen-III synthase [Phycisphaerales bacterium]|nr:uroporphyrinogen-III synthase [Phycisphaerales bacterium]
MNVWVTRDEPPDGPLGAALRRRGLSPILEPVITRRLHTDCADELSRLGPDDWLVLTSAYAINAVALEPARVPRVAVIGDESRRAAETRSLRVELVSTRHDVADLFEQLRRRVPRGAVCYPRSSRAAPPPPWPGVAVDSPVMYETLPRSFDVSVLNRVDVITVVSPSAVDAIHQRCPLNHIPQPFAAIGPATSAALRVCGVHPSLMAVAPSFDSLADAIAAFRQTGS